MCRLRNIAMRDYQESLTTGQTHTHTHTPIRVFRVKWGHVYETSNWGLLYLMVVLNLIGKNVQYMYAPFMAQP